MVRRTSTSSFGTAGRISHDSTKFYTSRMYENRPVEELGIKYVENPIPDHVINTTINGDATAMTELPDSSVHLMVTSPPYNVGKDYDRDLTEKEYRQLIRDVLSETYRVLVHGGRACINVANVGRRPYLPIHSWIVEEAEAVGFLMRGEIIWDKADFASPSTAWGSWESAANPILRDTHEYVLVFSKGTFSRANPEKRDSTLSKAEFIELTKSVWVFPPESATRVDHPAPFPEELPFRLIKLLSFAGEVVLDPFMGSGSTGAAALNARRSYVGYEIDEHYQSAANIRVGTSRSTGVRAIQSPVHIDNSVPPARTSHAIRSIVEGAFKELGAGSPVSDESLSAYITKAFDTAIKQFRLYPIWSCNNCTFDGNSTSEIGVKPERCPTCQSDLVYEVGSFQSRTTVLSKIFNRAVNTLFGELYELDLVSTGHGIKTHQYQLGKLAIALRGSPKHILYPNGEQRELNTAGMLRSDTVKKVTANAKQYLDATGGSFVVLTNASRNGAVARVDDIPVFNLTTKDGVDGFLEVARNNSH